MQPVHVTKQIYLLTLMDCATLHHAKSTISLCPPSIQLPRNERRSIANYYTDREMSVILGRSANLPTGLYIFTFRNFFFFIFLLSAKLSQYLRDRFSRFFSPKGKHLREFSRSGPIFPSPQGTLPRQPILCRNQNINNVEIW